MTNHLHLPTRDDPDHCGHEGCGLIWSDPVHAPSVALRKLSELPPDLRPLAASERASGAPFVPSQREAAPATHTGRPSMHSGARYVPADAKWIMCPEKFRTVGKPTLQCPYSSPLKAEVADHLARVHEYTEQAAGFYLANPWFANEDRKEWQERTRHLRREATPEEAAEFCDHPNGFGPMGCPCGASAPDEDPDEREIYDHPDGSPVWGHPITCPAREQSIARGETPLCAGRAGHIKGTIRQHLQEVHGWTGDMWSDWADSVNFLELPTVPKSILDDMEAVGRRAEQELANFLNPDITMEQIMADAANADAIDPNELNKAMDAMAPAQLEALLTEWWMDKAEEEVRQVVPKAVEYGALDLIQIGQDLALTMHREVTDAEAAELGIYFYLRGKLARWTDAVITGRQVSDDTLHDIGVYVRMAQRVRDAGGWPGLPKD